MPNPKTNCQSLNREYSIIITQYMTSDIHLTGTTHCRKGCLLHNSTPHERKISTQNMTAKGTSNTTDNQYTNSYANTSLPGANPEKNLTRAQPKARGCGYMGAALSMGSYRHDLVDAAQLST